MIVNANTMNFLDDNLKSDPYQHWLDTKVVENQFV